MARLGRSLFLALAAGAAGGAAASFLQRNGTSAHPTAKSAVRASLKLYERIRGVLGEVAENLSDVVAEVQAEMEQENQAAPSEPANKGSVDEHIVPFEMRTGESERKAHG